ncbi:hypothetical protein RHMOL_Rhmol11G0052800 [Rhododendron molle]|uniref:Uncharacterized protein n=1 Tax=Rhododendron molle TaxID=49168 RepID=A0ACC0LP20_RHOML|nr:hypothetical protein RHMOL_Rhmol11G0052800 [Rhododendron molle]
MREVEELTREIKMVEKASEEAVWAQEYAVALAESRAKETRPEFAEDTYTRPEPQIFVPSGFDGYEP